MSTETPRALTPRQEATKRLLDVLVAGTALVVTSPLFLVGWVAAVVETRRSGVFRQVRIGRDGTPFEVFKLRTMRPVAGVDTTVTTRHDLRITRSGAWLRRLKIDELPQLVNVLRGEMSLVGPRPDVPGFADRLEGADRILLSVRPGITGPAAVAYRHEEDILAAVADPERYNDEVIWPDKVRLNREYLEHYRLRDDLLWLARTVRTISEKDHSIERSHG
jgi:lipopolysaccharide/colanic/teichoic acid biosynthesis glycosyltransferase